MHLKCSPEMEGTFGCVDEGVGAMTSPRYLVQFYRGNQNRRAHQRSCQFGLSFCEKWYLKLRLDIHIVKL
jgi:hypothetical protein